MATTRATGYIRVSGEMYLDSSRCGVEGEGEDIIDHRVLDTSNRRHP